MKITNLKTFQNSEFNPGKGKLIRIAWFVIGRIFVNTYMPFPTIIKRGILKIFGAKIGDELVIKPKVNIKYPWLLEIGDNCWIGEKVWIDNLVKVKIENNVCISQGAMLLTGNHDYSKTSFDLITGEIILNDGVWIGARSIVCPGVGCSSHSILSVGSVATNDLEEYGIYQGNPAIWKKKRNIE